MKLKNVPFQYNLNCGIIIPKIKGGNCKEAIMGISYISKVIPTIAIKSYANTTNPIIPIIKVSLDIASDASNLYD
jgi:hypothetical protein